jgi:DNA adenine methylase
VVDILARPFLKWAGGKRQLLSDIWRFLPTQINNTIDAYVEPFLGGGAVFFFIYKHYNTLNYLDHSINHFYLFDVNEDLINVYNTIKNNVDCLVEKLSVIHERFYNEETEEARKVIYYGIRDKFNKDRSNLDTIAIASLFIFLNRTCFNGIYRVNKSGYFNVPSGGLKNPLICDKSNLLQVSEALQDVCINSGDYRLSEKYIKKNTFVYLDPPYRPINRTSSWNSYDRNEFDEKEQVALVDFCKNIHKKGAFFLLSNSDPKNVDKGDNFFEEHYSDFNIFRVDARRSVNSQGAKRGKIKELFITNYKVERDV